MSPAGRTAGTLKPCAPCCWNGSKEWAEAKESVINCDSSEEKSEVSIDDVAIGPLCSCVVTG